MSDRIVILMYFATKNFLSLNDMYKRINYTNNIQLKNLFKKQSETFKKA